MTQSDLIKRLTEGFYCDFAEILAGQVRDAGAVGLLYETVTAPPASLSRDDRHKVLFRGAYVLEKLYFADPASFGPFAGVFCRTDFPACGDASARRHFAKIMAHLLGHYMPPLSDLERIADSAADWAVSPQEKAAVRIWAVEVLKCCRTKVDWVAQAWDDILETMAHDATPGISCRMRKSWK